MLYFDTSFLTPLLLQEQSTARVERYVAQLPAGTLYISHWTRVEFASLIAREVCMSSLSPDQGREILGQFGKLIEESYRVVTPGVADFELAMRFVSEFSSGLRAGDALHLAIARNHDAEQVLSLDDGLLKAAKMLKVKAGRGIR